MTTQKIKIDGIEREVFFSYGVLSIYGKALNCEKCIVSKHRFNFNILEHLNRYKTALKTNGHIYEFRGE